VIVHTAAQPSHDRAAAIPFDDFDTNAVGTLNLLEAARQACPESPFVHMSTNKVYGDAPNRIPLRELRRAGITADPAYEHGIPETFTIDQSKHSLFGASKVAADVMVQEYGRYFAMPTCCLRGGCLTGPNHSGVELHGFLSYLVKCQPGRTRIQGFRLQRQTGSRQHPFLGRGAVSWRRLWSRRARARSITWAAASPIPCSILEAFKITEKFTGQPQVFTYVDQNRIGDAPLLLLRLAQKCARIFLGGILPSHWNKRSAKLWRRGRKRPRKHGLRDKQNHGPRPTKSKKAEDQNLKSFQLSPLNPPLSAFTPHRLRFLPFPDDY